MPRTLLAVLPLSQMNTADKITRGHYIAQQFKANQGQFPKTVPYTDVQLEDAANHLANAHTASQSRSSLDFAREKVAVGEYDKVFSAYRDWANQPDVAYNNKVRIELLGLEVSREAQPKGAMPVPTLRQPAGEVEGELDLVCDKVEGFAALIWLVAYGETQPADEEFRLCAAGTKLRQTLTLTSGLIAWIRVVAVGPMGMGPMSAPVKRRVL